MLRLSERISYVGVNDTDKVLFEGLWPLPAGVSYNSYIVADEKIALIDTVECGFEEEFLSNIHEAIGERSLDYLVVNHMEPDHSSLISYMLQEYPELQIIANAKTALSGNLPSFKTTLSLYKLYDCISLPLLTFSSSS